MARTWRDDVRHLLLVAMLRRVWPCVDQGVELSSQVAQQISMAYVITQTCDIHTGIGRIIIIKHTCDTLQGSS
jgi:hypothetical protein